MTDWYGKGKWGAGDRPLSSGPDQSAYDAGAQQRRFDEERRRREEREQAERARKKQEEWRRKDREGVERWANHPNRGSETSSDLSTNDDWDLDGILILAAIGALTFFLIKLCGMATAGLAPNNDMLAAIVDHGAWGVGLIGIGLGYRFHEILLPIAKVVAVVLILFFGSAIIVGIYRGISG